MPARRVHIATTAQSPLRDIHLLSKLTWHWRRDGHEVTTGDGKIIPPGTDVAMLHVDRSVVRDVDLPTNQTRCPFLNASVRDISKRTYSQLRLQAGDDWSGPVIIKSNLNCFGSPEWYQGQRPFSLRVRRQLARYSWRLARWLPPETYPTLGNLSEVPAWVWRREDLLVERFLPEREGELYAVRVWAFFGQSGYGYRLIGTQPTVKATTIVRHERLPDAPPAGVLETVRQHQLDFGKIDWVEHEGKVSVIDINKTPTVTSAPDNPRLRRLADNLMGFLTPFPHARWADTTAAHR